MREPRPDTRSRLRVPRASKRASRTVGCLSSATALLAALLATTATPAVADLVVCPPGVNDFTWDGEAATNNWNDGLNWNQDCTPGLLGQPYDDVVTIPAGFEVSLNDGESANVKELHNNGVLTVTVGAWLTTLEDSESHTLILQGGLASHGKFTVTSLLTWFHTGSGAPTQTTRRCPPLLLTPPFGYEPANDPFEEDCSLPQTPGRTVIAEGATMQVNGVGVQGRGGVNLSDGRVIENRGTVSLSNNGYIAADDGTKFLNFGKFVINNDFGYYQGFTKDDLDRPVGPSAFLNSGTVTKAAGNGVSIIAAAFSNSATGQVKVLTGTLTIMTPTANTERTARVQGGSRFGNGGCDAAEGCLLTSPDPTPGDQKVVTVQVTKKSDEVRPTEVNITEAATGLYKPVEITTPKASADRAVSYDKPLRFRIYLQLGAGDPTPASMAKNAPVFRNGVRLPNCNWTSQDPTKAKPTCVARKFSQQETDLLPGKDVVLVISSVQNSRYRVGR